MNTLQKHREAIQLWRPQYDNYRSLGGILSAYQHRREWFQQRKKDKRTVYNKERLALKKQKLVAQKGRALILNPI